MASVTKTGLSSLSKVVAFSVPKAAQGELLYLAAQLLSDKANLVTILRPEWEKAFAPIKARRKEWMARTE